MRNWLRYCSWRLRRLPGIGLTVPPMKDAKKQFADRLKQSMHAVGLEPIPSVLEREFNQRYMGGDITLHGVRRWLEAEVIPTRDKLDTLEKWLKADFLSFRPAKAGSLPDNQIQQPRNEWRAELPAAERETVDAYLALPVQQRKIVREVILAFAKAAL